MFCVCYVLKCEMERKRFDPIKNIRSKQYDFEHIPIYISVNSSVCVYIYICNHLLICMLSISTTKHIQYTNRTQQLAIFGEN